MRKDHESGCDTGFSMPKGRKNSLAGIVRKGRVLITEERCDGCIQILSLCAYEDFNENPGNTVVEAC